MERRVGQHHGDLRRALVDAALQLVAEGTDPGLRAVARRAGVSPGAPYHHFADRTALLAEVAREGFVALAEEQSRAGGSGGDRLEAMTAAYVRFARAHPTHYRVMLALLEPGPGQERLTALRHDALGTFDALVGAMVEANPSLSFAEAARRARLVWAMAHGAVQLGGLVTALPDPLDGEELAVAVGRAARQLAHAPQGDGDRPRELESEGGASSP
jgi:AcrR family transcriptional regulator